MLIITRNYQCLQTTCEWTVFTIITIKYVFVKDNLLKTRVCSPEAYNLIVEGKQMCMANHGI